MKQSIYSITSFSILSPACAFVAVTVPVKGKVLGTTGVHEHQPLVRRAPLFALIYGWDGDDTQVNDDNFMKPYADDGPVNQCTPAGVAVAESLSYDKDRVGSLARLAVAFSPPERALSLDIIENIDVICVSQDHIDIQAVVCEDGGCMTLSVPIKFPYSCDSNPEWLQGCVARNLEHLDESASSSPLLMQSTRDEETGEDTDICLLDTSDVEFPSWWIPPGCDEVMAAECTGMRGILNDVDFMTDIIALAQDSLNYAGEPYAVKEAKVAAVGPAGLCFKVRAEDTSTHERTMHILDVFYPFGQNLETVEALRAAVLGAVATA